jgi:phosphopantothenoylcysteine decarboxylase/phosphopantothenate--cysteine ligase
MGQALVNEALEQGAHVTHISGNSFLKPLINKNLKNIQVTTSEDMYEQVTSELSSKKYDIAIMAAAVSDFKLNQVNKKKIRSRGGDKITLDLFPTKKIINYIKLVDKNIFLVGFTAYHDVSNSFLISRANEKLKESSSDIIIANDVGRKNSTIGSDYNEAFIISKNKPVVHLPPERKNLIAKKIYEIIASYLD